MSEYLIKGSTLTAIADEVRTLSDTTGAKTPDVMANDLRSINENLDAVISQQVSLISQIVDTLVSKTNISLRSDGMDAVVNTQSDLLDQLGAVLTSKSGTTAS